jgi:hypothetical protein
MTLLRQILPSFHAVKALIETSEKYNYFIQAKLSTISVFRTTATNGINTTISLNEAQTYLKLRVPCGVDLGEISLAKWIFAKEEKVEIVFKDDEKVVALFRNSPEIQLLSNKINHRRIDYRMS